LYFAGVVNAVQYLGSGIGSLVIGFVLENRGWGYWAYAMMPGMIVAIIADAVLMKTLQRVKLERERSGLWKGVKGNVELVAYQPMK
jgi:sugar phosphate permease